MFSNMAVLPSLFCSTRSSFMTLQCMEDPSNNLYSWIQLGSQKPHRRSAKVGEHSVLVAPVSMAEKNVTNPASPSLGKAVIFMTQT